MQQSAKKIRDNTLVSQNGLDSSNNKLEQKILKISMYAALSLAIFGIVFGNIVGSKAVVFDGFVALIAAGLGFLSVITSRYIYKEDDDIFQYGYVRFEPVVNLFKSVILLIVCIYGFVEGIGSVFSGGYSVALGGATIYTFVALILCFCMFLFMRYFEKLLDSSLVKVDRVEWFIDCVLYGGSVLAFSLVLIFDKSQELSISAYIDPLLLAVLSIFLSISPLKIAITNFKDLVMIAPKELDDNITNILEELSKQYNFKDYDTHVAKNGRFFMVEVNILLDKNASINSVSQMDNLRDYICEKLQIAEYKIWLSVSFTGESKWL